MNLPKSFAIALALAAAAAVPGATAATAQDGLTGQGAQDQLVITVTDAGEADGVYELSCEDPAGGNHPEAQGACDAVRGAQEPFTPVAEDTMCTYMYGGSARATIEGSWAGQPVQASYSRVNGCEIARWDQLVPALPRVGADQD